MTTVVDRNTVMIYIETDRGAKASIPRKDMRKHAEMLKWEIDQQVEIEEQRVEMEAKMRGGESSESRREPSKRSEPHSLASKP
jgi:hypothetical protein